MTSPVALPGVATSPAQNAATDATRVARDKSLQAARDFEAIFVRQLLKPLEKAHALGGKSASSGSEVYGSMYVNSVADAITKGGGLGMAEVIADALSPQASLRQASPKASASVEPPTTSLTLSPSAGTAR